MRKYYTITFGSYNNNFQPMKTGLKLKAVSKQQI